jgi:hypothetical protein
MPMYEKQYGGGNASSWCIAKDTTNAKQWHTSSTKQTTLRSISTATTAEQSDISYGIYRSKHNFVKSIMKHLHQQTMFRLEPHTYSYQPSGAQNATDGLVTMKN